jgi:hypothetical protein
VAGHAKDLGKVLLQDQGLREENKEENEMINVQTDGIQG